uniref:Uncharacterized protein n=1 Tax=Meloidogyne javanica TaxID=6303 RepID=A0A915M4S2_MELJA
MCIQVDQIKKVIFEYPGRTFTKDDIDIIAYRAGLKANITWIGGMLVLCVIIVAMFAILLLYLHSIMTKQRSQNNGNQPNIPTNRSGAGGAQTSASLSKEAIESISDGAVLKSRIAIIDGTLVVVALIVILFAVLLFFLHKWFKDVDSKVTQTTDPSVTNQRSQNNPQQNIDRNEGVGDIQEVVVQGSQTQGSQDSNKNEQDFPSSSRIGTNEDQIKMLEVVQFEKSIQLVKIQIDAQAD